MKKNYKSLLIVATAVLGLSASAQVSLYSFTQYSSTYSPISGGTVFATSTTDDGSFCNPGAPTTNNATGPGIPIGFPFTFNFNTFDVIGVDNNGWIAFGQASLNPAVDLNNSNLGQGIAGTNTAPNILQHRVCALGRDLVSNNGSLRIETIGSAPNRECVIQWTNYKVYLGSDLLNFQIRLKETSNIIDIVYGSWTVTSTTGAQVGIRGNGPNDFSNRTVTSPTPWSASIPGTANTDVCNFATGFQPASGQVYEWTPPPPCSGPPASNTVLSTFSLVCPGGTSTLNLSNSYTTTGNSFQWYVSDVSAVGPFTLVTGATNPIYTPTNITVTSWYQVVVTCSVGPVSTSMTPYNLHIAGTTTNTVPYFENFEGISANNQLPNCSWSASSPTTINQTYTNVAANNRIPNSGSKFAAFRYGTAAAGDYFYSNGIQMEPGITYSANLWYTTDGVVGWQELSILYGTTQATTGLVPIVTKTAGIGGQFYQPLGNTFTVPNSGLYYLAIKCRANTSPNYLSWDDLSVTIPCQLNSPSVTVSSNPTVACEGQEVTMTASAGDSFLWSTGDITSSITFTPYTTMTYSVIVTNSISNCSTTVNQLLIVNNTPQISIFASSSTVCAGSTATLHAVGATSYMWNNNSSNNSVITVTPTGVSVSYSVSGTSGNGCTGTASQVLAVRNLPPVAAVNSHPNQLCVGETATLTGQGAISYQWLNNNISINTQIAHVSPVAPTTYTLIGTDAFGCSNMTTVPLNVDACTGLKEVASGLSGVKLYPNPSNSDVTVELNTSAEKKIQVTDVTGRVISSTVSSDEKVLVSTKDLAAGVYYVRISANNASAAIKFIKN